MDTASIKEALKQLIGHLDIPYYVCAADTHPKLGQYPAIVIQNINPYAKGGEHWISWWAKSKDRCEYFDSFGFPVQEYPHLKFPYKYIEHDNTLQLQSNDNNVCGIWCVRFAHDKAKGMTFNQFIKQWKHPHQSNEYNDKKILKWFIKNTFIIAPGRTYNNNQTCISYNDYKNRKNCNSM